MGVGQVLDRLQPRPAQLVQPPQPPGPASPPDRAAAGEGRPRPARPAPPPPSAAPPGARRAAPLCSAPPAEAHPAPPAPAPGRPRPPTTPAHVWAHARHRQVGPPRPSAPVDRPHPSPQQSEIRRVWPRPGPPISPLQLRLTPRPSPRRVPHHQRRIQRQDRSLPVMRRQEGQDLPVAGRPPLVDHPPAGVEHRQPRRPPLHPRPGSTPKNRMGGCRYAASQRLCRNSTGMARWRPPARERACPRTTSTLPSRLFSGRRDRGLSQYVSASIARKVFVALRPRHGHRHPGHRGGRRLEAGTLAEVAVRHERCHAEVLAPAVRWVLEQAEVDPAALAGVAKSAPGRAVHRPAGRGLNGQGAGPGLGAADGGRAQPRPDRLRPPPHLPGHLPGDRRPPGRGVLRPLPAGPRRGGAAHRLPGAPASTSWPPGSRPAGGAAVR